MPATKNAHRPLLDQLREQYEAVHAPPPAHSIEDFQTLDGRLRKTLRWLERAVTYLNAIRPTLDHRFDLGYGLVFESPRFSHGSVWPHEQRIGGHPVLDEISVYYEIAASKPLSIEVPHGWIEFAEKTLDAFNLKYTARPAEGDSGALGKSVYSIAPVIPARIAFRANYTTGEVAVSLVNVDRLERVSLDFQGSAIDEPALEDLLHLVLGRDTSFLKRAPLSGLHPAKRKA